MILAGIDIGTNTLRLLVADIGPDSFQEIYADRRTTRLGQDLDRSGALSVEAQERTLRALRDFSEQIRDHEVLHTAAVGTSALRNASNSLSFIQAVHKLTGIDICVISGEEEARLTLSGVARALSSLPDQGAGRLTEPALLIDIGGGSTELIAARPGGDPAVASLGLGAVYLTERFFKHDPPTEDEWNSLTRAVREELDRQAGSLHPDPAGACVGTAGTITTLAAVDLGLLRYEPESINGHVLTRVRLGQLVDELRARTLGERKHVRGLEPGREDIILAGALVAREIVERYAFASLVVSDGGLREGIVLDLYEKVRHDPAGRERTLMPQDRDLKDLL